MVRLIRVTDKRGRIVWAEDAPTACPAGHEGAIVPSHGGCPECGEPVRLWRCRADGCTAPDQYDDEHEHHSRK